MIFSAQKCDGTHYLLGLQRNPEKILLVSVEKTTKPLKAFLMRKHQDCSD